MTISERRPHPQGVKQEYAGKIVRYRESPLEFIRDMWGLVPQPVRKEYEKRWKELKRASGPLFTKLRGEVTPEWFGVKADFGWKWWNGEEFIEGREAFLREGFITWQQTLVLLSIEKAVYDLRLPRHISIKSGHGIGKSSMTSWLILWFLFCYYYAQVPVTAPTSNQMHDVLWKELAIWLARMPEEVKEIYEWQHDYINIKYKPEAWFARAKTSTKENTEALAGIHADNVLIAVDEASGVPEQVFNTAEGALTSGNVWVLLIGNPTRTTGYFYDSHNKNKVDWQCHSFNGEESPVVDYKYIARQAKRHGIDSNEYKIRVRGEFPAEDSMDDKGYLQLISANRININQSLGVDDIFIGRKVLAIDPSGDGGDACEFCLRDNYKAKIIKTLATTNDKEIAEMIITFADRYGLKSGDIVIEGFGYGASASKEVAIATKGRLDIYTVLTGNKPEYEEKVSANYFKRLAKEMDEEGTDMFLNLRALAHFRMRDWLVGGGILLDNDPEHSEWQSQLLSLKYKYGLQNSKIQIMPKQEMNKLRIMSPNKSDALMLSFLLMEDSESESFRGESVSFDDGGVVDRFSVL